MPVLNKATVSSAYFPPSGNVENREGVLLQHHNSDDVVGEFAGLKWKCI